MHFAIQKDTLVKTLRDVSNAVATRVVQPVLSNILIEAIDNTQVRFVGTDLDLTIETKLAAVVYSGGSITLPGKKLLEIVSKMPNELVSFQVNKETLETTISCLKSKFTLTSISAQEFPKIANIAGKPGCVMPADILSRAIAQTGFAAASYDQSSILGGVYLLIQDGVFEATATDGSRLAHRREELNVSAPSRKQTKDDKEQEAKSSTATLEKPSALKAIVPARACSELLKLIDSKDFATIKIAIAEGQICFETENFVLTTRLISGEYPRYHELFPKEFTYLALFDRSKVVSAIERVAVMSDERTNLVKMHFAGETLTISSNTPDLGGAQEEAELHFEGQVIDVAVNVRYVLDVLQKMSADRISLEMTGPLKPLIFKEEGDENYKYLLMPVQAK